MVAQKTPVDRLKDSRYLDLRTDCEKKSDCLERLESSRQAASLRISLDHFVASPSTLSISLGCEQHM